VRGAAPVGDDSVRVDLAPEAAAALLLVPPSF